MKGVLQLAQIAAWREFLGHSMRTGHPSGARRFSELRKQSWNSGKNKEVGIYRAESREQTVKSRDGTKNLQRAHH